MLEKIKEIDRAIGCGYYYGALALTLTLPDICGKVYCPELNGKNEKGERYRKWFDDFVAQVYMREPNWEFPNGSNIAFNGCACYLLRCAYLHSGNYDLKAQNKKIQIKEFRLSYSKPVFKYHVYDVEQTDTGDFILNVDVSGLCKVICMAATDFYNATPNKSLFKDSLIAYVEEGAENGSEKTD